MIERNHVYNADCMLGMAEMPDNYIDLAIVDPPYGIDFAKQHIGKGWLVRESKNWDSNIPDAAYFDELFRVSKEQIIWGGNYFTQYLPGSQGWVFWDKGQRDFSLADGELAFTSFDKALRVVEYSRGKAASKKTYHFHPTQKPVDLYRWLLHNYAKEGDLILDTHVGSGSSIIACIDKGFDYIGYEIDADYYKAMNDRIHHFTRQTALSDAIT